MDGSGAHHKKNFTHKQMMMETLLKQRNHDRKPPAAPLGTSIATTTTTRTPIFLPEALQRLASALRDVIPLLADDHTIGTDSLKEETAQKQSRVTAETTIHWLLDLCATIPSEFLEASHLTRAIWEAAQRTGEAAQQAALFDVLGSSEPAMQVLLQVAPRLEDIQQIPLSELLFVLDKTKQQQSPPPESTETLVDWEEERRQLLLHEALDAAQVAAIAKAEWEAIQQPYSTGIATATHTLVRKSEREAHKMAEKAAKRAAQALQRARDAGVMVDDEEFLRVGMGQTDPSTAVLSFGAGGLVNRSKEELLALRASLLPEGSKQYYDHRGLPLNSIHETFPNFERVTIPAPVRDATHLPVRLKIADILDPIAAKVFEGTVSLNPMQSTVFEMAYHNRDNLLICAPTGCGKT